MPVGRAKASGADGDRVDGEQDARHLRRAGLGAPEELGSLPATRSDAAPTEPWSARASRAAVQPAFGLLIGERIGTGRGPNHQMYMQSAQQMFAWAHNIYAYLLRNSHSQGGGQREKRTPCNGRGGSKLHQRQRTMSLVSCLKSEDNDALEALHRTAIEMRNTRVGPGRRLLV